MLSEYEDTLSYFQFEMYLHFGYFTAGDIQM